MTHDARHDGRDEGPVDLAILWPERRSPERWAALVARIEGAAAPELARRAGRLTTVDLVDAVVAAVARFAAPALIAAAAAVIIALGVARRTEASASEVVAARTLSEETVQEALRGSASTGGAAWIAQQGAPSVDEVVDAAYAGAQE
jgi:hypothetical protein